MKYLKKFNENLVDIDSAIVKIGEHFSEEKVASMLEEESKEWSDGGSSEAQKEATEEVILQDMINWYKKEHSKQMDESEEAKLEDAIRSHYSILN